MGQDELPRLKKCYRARGVVRFATSIGDPWIILRVVAERQFFDTRYRFAKQIRSIMEIKWLDSEFTVVTEFACLLSTRSPFSAGRSFASE